MNVSTLCVIYVDFRGKIHLSIIQVEALEARMSTTGMP